VPIALKVPPPGLTTLGQSHDANFQLIMSQAVWRTPRRRDLAASQRCPSGAALIACASSSPL